MESRGPGPRRAWVGRASSLRQAVVRSDEGVTRLAVEWLRNEPLYRLLAAFKVGNHIGEVEMKTRVWLGDRAQPFPDLLADDLGFTHSYVLRIRLGT